MDLAQFKAPAWTTAIGTLVSYGIILLFMTLVLFILPYLVFSATGLGV